MSRRKAKARPQRAGIDPLRQLQQAIAVAKCIRIAADYPDDDLDIADAVAGLVVLLGLATVALDQPGGGSA